MRKFLPLTRPVLGTLLLLVVALLAGSGWLLGAGSGWVLAGALVFGGWLGWAIRQVWIYPGLLARAEARWAASAPASEVAELLGRAPLARGELGYRIRLLRGLANASLGYRERAWLDFLDAQLVRQAWWKHRLLSWAFRQGRDTPTARRLTWGERLIRLAPRMGRLRHLQGILLLRSSRPEALHLAWEHFEAALPLSWEDPLVLEDLMLAGLQHGREDMVEQALAVLRARHGDGRIPWDRGAAGMYLLRQGRPAEALALVQGLPPHRRDHPALWLVETVSRRRLGDREGAWQVIEAALAEQPDSFRLWLERHQIALELHRDQEARRSLDMAWPTIPNGAEGAALQEEWYLRRAEFAFWWEDDPAFARELLASVPPEARGDHQPPLRLQIQVAEGQFEAAYAEVVTLLQASPEDPDLLLLQAECLLGMDAWEALLPFLQGLGESCRERPSFWHLRGLAHANLGEGLPARLDLERAVRMDPQTLRYLLDAGHACAELGDWDRAESHWRKALQLEPQEEETLIHLAEARRELEDLEGARRYLRECLLHHPDSLEAQTHLAELEAN
ncbi:MAG: tetratricopeptide repeat protein [Holophagaceae bacterium]|nr:tetratricopeptide repeat protein [Holophagaceae bacterium]